MPKVIEESICWNCQNACGKCCWSRELKPIDNWVADKTNWSYMVKSCPYYKPNNKPNYEQIPLTDLAIMLNTSTTTIRQLCDYYLIKKTEKLGYSLIIDMGNRGKEYFLKKVD